MGEPFLRSNRLYPNFIIAGTSAGGTSFLSAAIVQHPQVYMPVPMRPEPHFFYKSWEYQKGEEYYQKKWFSNVKNETAIGERSSSYIFGGEQVARKMFDLIPEAKIIITLRNPIERAYANYRYTALQGLESVDFDTALAKEEQRVNEQQGIWAEIQPFNYTGRGFYSAQINAFLKYFKQDQLLILKSEEIRKHPQETFTKVFNFISVDPQFEPKLPPDHSSLSVKDPALQMQLRNYFQERFDLVIEAIRKHEEPEAYCSSEDDVHRLQDLKQNLQEEKVPMSDWARSFLQDVYSEDISKLTEFVDFSVADWR